MVFLPEIFLEEKYAEWVDFNTKQPVFIKTGAPKELLRAYDKFLKVIEMDDRFIDE